MSDNINLDEVPEEIVTAAVKICEYAARAGWKNWLFIGVSDRSYSEQLKRQRDEARRVANYWMSEASKECALAQRANKERDELRAEVEWLKSQSGEQNRCMNQLRELWKHLPNIENKYDERLAYHIDELIDRLKADKARLDWLEKAKSAEYCEGPRGWSLNGWSGPYSDTLRDAIDTAMKGAE